MDGITSELRGGLIDGLVELTSDEVVMVVIERGFDTKPTTAVLLNDLRVFFIAYRFVGLSLVVKVEDVDAFVRIMIHGFFLNC